MITLDTEQKPQRKKKIIRELKKNALDESVNYKYSSSGRMLEKTELTKIAVVTAIGIDKNENKEIEVSLQFVNPTCRAYSGAKGSSGSGEEKHYIVKTSNGETVFEAIRNCSNTIDRKVFYSNVKVIIIGEKLAKEGISQSLDYSKGRPKHHQPQKCLW